MDASFLRDFRIAPFVILLTVSGCALSGTRRVAPTDSQPFSFSRNVLGLGAGALSSKAGDPEGCVPLITPECRGDGPATPATPAPPNGCESANNHPQPSSRAGRTGAKKGSRRPVNPSQGPGGPTGVPSATSSALPATPKPDKDDEEDDQDDQKGNENNNQDKNDRDGDKNSQTNSRNGQDNMSDEEDEEETEDLCSEDDQRRRNDRDDQREQEELHEEEEFKTDLLDTFLGLQDARLGVFGWVQANYTANPRVGVDGSNFLLIPNSLANAFVFQQVYLVFEQQIKYRDQVDYGFRFDNLFGVASQNFHDVGLLNRTFAPNTFGYDPVQFYGELHLPIGEGIDIRGGRLYALPGYETATAPGRPLLSTSDMFSFGAHPYTQFGVLSTWHVTDRIELYNGVVNGWNHWISQRNPWSYAGGMNWESEDERTNLTVTLNAGFTQFARVFPDEVNGVPTPPQLLNNPRLPSRNSTTTLFNIVLTHHWTDALTMVIETNEAIVNHLDPLIPGMPRGHASYYGLAGWFLYALTEKLTGVARSEVFRDNNGLLTGFADNFYESTLGLIYKPFPWLWFRPETRFDWAQFSRPFYSDNPSDHFRSNYQFTFGFDTIFIF